MRVQVRILGCGTSTGVPVPTCRCSVCRSGHERNRRLRCSALIAAENGAHLLIDTSSDLRQQALRWEIPRIDAVLYTHHHADHILGLEDLRGFNFSQQQAIPAFGSEVTLAEIRRCFSYVFNPDPRYEGGGAPQVELHTIDESAPFTAAGIHVEPFPLIHGLTFVTGYRIGDFGYATDCKMLSDRALQVLQDVPVLVLDALRYEQHKAHLTIPEAIEVARALGAERTILTHMTHTVDYDEVSAKLPAGVELAYDGMVLECG